MQLGEGFLVAHHRQPRACPGAERELPGEHGHMVVPEPPIQKSLCWRHLVLHIHRAHMGMLQPHEQLDRQCSM